MITRLELCNIGRHRQLAVDFQPGLIGIFGPNGAGKSTLLHAAYAALSGDFGRLGPTRAACICQQSSADEPAYIRLRCRTRGHELLIQHGLRKAATFVEVDGHRQYGSQKVREELRRLFNVHESFLREFVFKAQDEITSLLHCSPTERLRLWQLWTGTQICEQMWQALGECLASETAAVGMDDESYQRLCQEVEQHRALAASWQQQLEQHQASACTDESVRQWRLQLRRYRRRRQYLRELKRLRSQLSELRQQRPGCPANLPQRRQRLEEQLRQVRQDLERLGRELIACEQEQQRQRQYQECVAQWRALKRSPVARPDPQCFQKLTHQLAQLEQQRQQYRQVARLLRAGQPASCPVCQRPFENGRAVLAHWRQTYRHCCQQIKQLRRQLDAFTDQQQQYHRYRQRLEVLRQRAKSCSRPLTTAVLATVRGKHRQLQALCQSYEQKLAVLLQRERAYLNWRGRYEQVYAEAQHLVRRIHQLKAPRTDQAIAIRQQLRQWRDHQTEQVRLRGQLEGARAALSALEAQLQEANQARRRRQAALQAREQLVRLRHLMHSSQLPARLHGQLAGVLEDGINRWLGIMGSPFCLEVRPDDLDFLVHVSGRGVYHPRQLSGGQRVVLSVAVWLTVASLADNELGILALDEPTAHLDDANRAYLVQALHRLADQVRGVRQVFIVTHADMLRSAMTQIVDLEPP